MNLALNWLGLVLCFLAGVASAVATYCLRMSHLQAALSDNPSFTRLMYLGAAVASYGIGFVLYALALRRLPISFAYPFMTACTIILVALVGVFFLQEPIGILKLCGFALMLSGVFLLAL